jgi:phage baseplate assembly protein W
MTIALRNLLVPFRRDKKRDFATATGAALLASKVRQALLTEADTPRSSGELPWRTAFGGSLGLLRFRNNVAVLRELARVYVQHALERWVPGAKLLELKIESIDNKLVVRIRVAEGGNEAEVGVPLPM